MEYYSDSSSDAIMNDTFLDDWEFDNHLFNELVEECKRRKVAETSIRRTRAPPKNRDRAAAHERLIRDHFAPDRVYDNKDFKRRFRMSRDLFIRIAGDLEARYPFFQQTTDVAGRVGFSTYQKVAAAISLLSTGNCTDLTDENMKISDRTTRICLYAFCESICEVYGPEYLRPPNANDIQQLYQFHEGKHGFPRMLGSLDCMHCEWENYPTAYHGVYTRGDHGVPTIALEAVASHDLWIWHAFFGVPGSHNDITIIRQSSLLVDFFTGRAPDTSFEVNGTRYKYGYYLTDGIYPEWAMLVKSFSDPDEDKRKFFKRTQESARKDIEWAFARLKKKWHILKQPSRQWHTPSLSKVMYACVILHNLTLEDAGRSVCTFVPEDTSFQPQVAEVGGPEYLTRVAEVQNNERHNSLRHDLMEHVWANRHS